MKPSKSGYAGWRGRGAAVSAFALVLTAAWSPPAIVLAQSSPAGVTVGGQPLTLNAALRRAVEADPAKAGLDARLRAVDAGVRQADLKPNPTLGLTVENLPTLGGGDILGRTETTLSYEQRLERGGDRPARTTLARSEGLLVVAQARIAQLDRMEAVQRAWADAMAAQATLEIARERLSLAERFQTEVQRRVNAARDPLFAGARAEAELAQAQIDFDQAEIAVRVARIVLAKFWDGTADFNLGQSDFEDTSASRVAAGEVASADLEAFRARQAIAEAQARLEEARAVPDPTVSVGVRHIWDNEVALVFGGSIPLQRHDRNQGAIDRARAESLAAQADQNALRQERERERIVDEIAAGIAAARTSGSGQVDDDGNFRHEAAHGRRVA